jgi:hypothetical protein
LPSPMLSLLESAQAVHSCQREARLLDSALPYQIPNRCAMKGTVRAIELCQICQF